MEQVGTFSKTVKNIQDMEKIMREYITLQMGNMQIGGIVMDKIGISSKTVKNLQDMEKITPEPITLQMENM